MELYLYIDKLLKILKKCLIIRNIVEKVTKFNI